MLPFPDLLLHTMRQVFTLAFEPCIELFGLLHFCLCRERARRRAALHRVLCRRLFADPLLQDLALHIQIAHCSGRTANLLKLAQPSARRPLQPIGRRAAFA